MMIDRVHGCTIPMTEPCSRHRESFQQSDKEIQMSEKISIGEQAPDPAGVVELGSASKETRGYPAWLGLLDGGLSWPFLFYIT